ncbi:hypothetical protein Dimus_009327 [Dionaea muscipula]
MSDPSRPATGYPAPHPTTANGYPPGSNTAYPYAATAPPPQPSGFYFHNTNTNGYNQNPYYAPTFVPHHVIFLRRFFAFVIGLLVIFAVILLVVWLALRPRLPEFRVDSLSLTGFNLSSSQISGRWDVRFAVSNPNTKLHAYYDELVAYVFYSSDLIAQNQLPPFDQPTKSQSNLTAEMVASSAYVPGSVASNIGGERSQGTLHFNVRVLAVVRFTTGSWRARRRLLRVICNNLAVVISSNAANGTLSGGPRKCDSVL